MPLSDDFAAAEAMLAEVLGGQTVTVFAGGSGITFTATLDPEMVDEKQEEEDLQRILSRPLVVCTDGSQGYAAFTPRLHMRVTIESTEYQVAKFSLAPPLAVLTLSRPDTSEHARANLRRNATRRS
jgi:hypothetical protein